MTLSGWRLILFAVGIVWAMLVFWNFSNAPFAEALPLALGAWSIPIGRLYVCGRMLGWLARQLRA